MMPDFRFRFHLLHQTLHWSSTTSHSNPGYVIAGSDAARIRCEVTDIIVNISNSLGSMGACFQITILEHQAGGTTLAADQSSAISYRDLNLTVRQCVRSYDDIRVWAEIRRI